MLFDSLFESIFWYLNLWFVCQMVRLKSARWYFVNEFLSVTNMWIFPVCASLCYLFRQGVLPSKATFSVFNSSLSNFFPVFCKPYNYNVNYNDTLCGNEQFHVDLNSGLRETVLHKTVGSCLINRVLMKSSGLVFKRYLIAELPRPDIWICPLPLSVVESISINHQKFDSFSFTFWYWFLIRTSVCGV